MELYLRCPAIQSLCLGVCEIQAYRRGGRAKKSTSNGDLTEEQKQEIREAFDLFDTDGSGARWRPAQALRSP
jgi:hypothetical protein